MDRLESVRRRLPRRASLKHRKWIRTLFDRSEPGVGSLASGCIRLVYYLVSDADPSETRRVFAGFSPGPQIRGAVRRNRVKRHLRECYRQEQGVLLQALSSGTNALALMIVFRGRSIQPFSRVQHDMNRAVATLGSLLSEQDPPTL